MEKKKTAVEKAFDEIIEYREMVQDLGNSRAVSSTHVLKRSIFMKMLPTLMATFGEFEVRVEKRKVFLEIKFKYRG